MNNPDNYRPISILPALSKIFERHIHTHLMAFLTSNDLICKTQSGFRSFHSCQTALTSLVDAWASDIDRNKLVGVLLIDLRKAFDLVNHELLLKKLKLYRCSTKCLSVLTSYLSERTQYTVFQGQTSASAKVTVGVPQGSIIGPLLFLLFINDIHFLPKSDCHMFADDSTFYTSSSDICTIESNFESDLNHIHNWCQSNQMSLHIGKTKTMLLTTRQKRAHLPRQTLNVNFANTEIECVSSHKLLGVTIDHHLNWKEHCDEVCNKVRKKLFLLRKLKNILPRSARLQFFNSFILPHIDYCSNVWYSSHANQLKSLNTLQKRAMRLILNVPYDTPSTVLFKSMNWMSIESRFHFNISLLVYKCLHNLTPSYLNFFSVNNNRTRAATRNDLNIPYAKKDILKNSFRVQGAKIYNSLPCAIRESCSFNAFKLASFKHFMSKFFSLL